MKKLLALALLCVVVFVGCAPPTEPVAEAYRSAYEAVNALELHSGELRVLEDSKNAAGDKIQTLEDDAYVYRFNAEEKELVSICASTKEMEEIVRRAGETVESGDLTKEIDVMGIVRTYFPEYEPQTVQIEQEMGSGDPIGWYRYTVRDLRDELVLNTARIEFSYDRQLTFLQGTHNTLDAGMETLSCTREEAVAIAFRYLVEDMAAAQRGENGGAFAEEMPEYEVFFDTVEDMRDLKMEKRMHGKRVAWLVEFTVHTSWGEVDDIFDPLIHIYVDAQTGEVLEMNQTDGG